MRRNTITRASRRIALVYLVTALSGCVFVISPFGQGDSRLQEKTVRGEGSAKILWLPVSGFISDMPSPQAFGLVEQPSTLSRIAQALDKASTDDDIAAVVVRINSPGGTVAAADEIYARLTRYHETSGVPVIASLGGVATSGGYYIAMAADTVIAQPTTITGSIGVILLGVNIAGLMNKLGIENQSYTSGAHKDILSPLHEANADERAIVQTVVDSLFRRFVAVVKQNRPGLDRGRLDAVTDGRIFAADDALRLGLVDEIGHINDVVTSARARAGVDRARVIRYYQGRTAPATLLASTSPGDVPTGTQAGLSASIKQWLAAQAGPMPLYLWPAHTGR